MPSSPTIYFLTVLLQLIQNIGGLTLRSLHSHGRWGIFMANGLGGLFRAPFRWNHFLTELRSIGFESIVLISFTAVFTGMVLGLQGYNTLKQYGSEGVLGIGVAISLFTELGPVLTALLLTGRSGSAMCAEMGVYRTSEQTAALESMAIDPYNYLVGPKILASLVASPILAFLFCHIGVLGAYLAGVILLGVDPASFYHGVVRALENPDLVRMCLSKSLVFGFLMVMVCAFKGHDVLRRKEKGTRAVAKATTEAVVYTSVMVLLWDYLLTSLIL
jgi:phospholipid/cholesterol/gamma-HCH transport system permease protein